VTEQSAQVDPRGRTNLGCARSSSESNTYKVVRAEYVN
jgi:hypothetical protein